MYLEIFLADFAGRVKIDQQKESHWAATEIDIQGFVFGIGCSKI